MVSLMMVFNYFSISFPLKGQTSSHSQIGCSEVNRTYLDRECTQLLKLIQAGI